MSEQSNKRTKPQSAPAQDFPFVWAESRFSCCQLEGCPLMYDRAILLMSKARQRGFHAFASFSLGPDQLEAAHWPKEIRNGFWGLWCWTEWTHLLLLECFLGFLPCTILLILTQVFGMYISIFCPISAPLARALKPQRQLIGWGKKCESGKSEDGINCEVSLASEVSA